MPSVMLGFACPMNLLISIGGIPAATHRLAYVCRRPWKTKPWGSAAVGEMRLARSIAGRNTALYKVRCRTGRDPVEIEPCLRGGH